MYAQYAAVIAEQAAAVIDGDDERRTVLVAERDAAAEHFAELRAADATDTSGVTAFSDALTDALHELRHHDAVDHALGRRLLAMREAGAARDPVPALSSETSPAARLDVRF